MRDPYESDPDEKSTDDNGPKARVLLDPEMYPAEEVKADKRELERQLGDIEDKIEDLEREVTGLSEEMSSAESEHTREIIKQEAVIRRKQIECKEHRGKRVRKKMGLLFAIEQGRQAIDRDVVTVSLEQVLDGAAAPELARHLQSKLTQFGLERAESNDILDVLAFEVPEGSNEGERQTVSEQLSKHHEADSPDPEP